MTCKLHIKNRRQGLTLVETLMALVILAIFAVFSVRAIDGSVDDARYQSTLRDMLALRNAMVGNPDLVSQLSAEYLGTSLRRNDFGFLGDIGALPVVIEDLLNNDFGNYVDWTMDTTTLLGAGWKGPYIKSEIPDKDFTKDAWGNAYTYTTTASTSLAPATIVSEGADGAAGGTGFDADITVNIPLEMVEGEVTAFYTNAGAAYKMKAQAELWYRDGVGSINSKLNSMAANDWGYSGPFSNIPFGTATIKIYRNSKGAPTGTVGPVSFLLDQAFYTIPQPLTDQTP